MPTIPWYFYRKVRKKGPQDQTATFRQEEDAKVV